MTRRIVAILAGLFLLAGATACTSQSAQNDPQAESNFDAQSKNDPVPTLNDSLERANISEHLKRNNIPDRVRYIYLLTDIGGIYAYFVIKGKVTSTGAQLTPTDDFAKKCGTCDWEVVQGPTDDGSFGGDEGGIYFFTDTGMEVQWNGKWLLTDQPLKITSPDISLRQ